MASATIASVESKQNNTPVRASEGLPTMSPALSYDSCKWGGATASSTEITACMVMANTLWVLRGVLKVDDWLSRMQISADSHFFMPTKFKL
jgi:hypothetical protein